ncbi:MAG: retropepsin-like aspartic protease [Flavobacterium sp.]|uniref:retropepsin-like aspartic protease n=1 Tax=Flavobacterium sp. TaxID=239 RepID=UPI0022C9D175|nr:retropepsin-like aspartic protease [Flavobacterium sp.]MCZ8169546.1 retropepsin-like aspartic protease [Flavobacterium sp.]MCZ8296426.1 retropepsin-like aspartic protease [Flavobacterium sp.]
MKSIFYIKLVLFFITQFIVAQPSTMSIEQILKSGSLEMGTVSTETVPIFYQKKMPFVKVEMNTNTYLFLVDTGSSLCIISKDMLGPDNVVLDKKSVTDVGGSEFQTEVVLSTLKIGNSYFKKVACLVGSIDSISTQGCLKIDGIIGSNLLKLSNWEINPVNQTLSFSTNPFEKKENSIELDFELSDSFLPLIQYNFMDEVIFSVIDTGYSDYFEMNNYFLKKVSKQKRGKLNMGKGKHAIGINSTISGTLTTTIIDTIKVNPVFFSKVPVIFTENKPRIGSAFLANYIFNYNFLAKKIILTPVNTNPITEKVHCVNFSINESNELIVSFVWLNEQTKKSKIEVGSKVLKIDDMTCYDMTMKKLCELKQYIDTKDTIVLTLLNANKVTEHTLFKIDKFPME